MSDYGFKTHDEQDKIAINAKNPIFGFDMGHKPRAFKTFRITDAKQSPIHNGGTPDPNPPGYDGWQTDETYTHGSERELIKKVKHGYNFRPVGYATITGTMKISRYIKITQTQRAGSYGGNYSKYMTQADTNTYEFTPNQFNTPWISFTGIGLWGAHATLQPSDFSNTTWQYGIENYLAYYYGLWYDEDEEYPIQVEFDDEYIYFYRKWNWYDGKRRIKFNWNGSTSDDLQERVQISDNFVGSTYIVTVYLCPYPLKELI